MPNSPVIADVIQALAAGTPVDWDSLNVQDEDESVRAILHGLRLVARVAEIHGTRADGSDAKSAETGRSHAAGADMQTRGVIVRPALRSWGALTVLELVGRGSYGDVYRAWDTKLDREVALKLLHSEPAQAAGGSVVEEGRLLARLRHPNVVTIYGADRVDGRVGLWMEFLEGRTLEQLVRERGPLTADEAARIAVEICRGLAAVHGAGLVHGDLTAKNVMLEDGGRVALMDFGASGHVHPAANGHVTGTPLYIAPEVLKGAPATPQSDLYSLGVLLFRLTTGTYPVVGATLREVRQAHDQQTRRRVRDLRPDLPERFVAVIDRALAIDPAARFGSAAAMESALAGAMSSNSPLHPNARRRWLAVGAVAVVIVAALGATMISPSRVDNAVQDRLRFQARDAVLITKFDNRTGEAVFDGAVEYALQRGLSESDVISLVPDERVEDALKLMKRPAGTILDRAVGREVALRDGGIKVLLAGRVERFGSDYVITAQLIDPADGSVVATIGEGASGQGEVLAALQRQAARVRVALGERWASIRGADPEIEPATTGSLQAFQLYSQSYQLGRQGKWPAALEIARQIVAVDPDFASGWIWLAWAAKNSESAQNVRSSDDASMANYRHFVERGVQLAGSVPEWERHWILGSYYTLTAQHERAIPHYQALLRLRPDHYYAHNNLINAYVYAHRPEHYGDWLAMMRRLGDQRPNQPAVLANAARAAVYESGRVDSATPYLDRLADLAESDDPIGLEARFYHDFGKAHVLWYSGDLQGTTNEVRRIESAFQSYPDRHRIEAIMGVVGYYLVLGRAADASRFVASLQPPNDRAFGELTLAWGTGDQTMLRRVLTERGPMPRPAQWVHGPVYVRAGLLGLARQYVDRQLPAYDEGYALIARGQLLLADGHVQRAVADLRTGVELAMGYNHNNPAYWWGCESLADALWRLGQPDDAITSVETCNSNEFRPIPVWAPFPVARMHLQLRLADLYRRVGQVASAQRLEEGLRARLALADRDFPLVEELRSRN